MSHQDRPQQSRTREHFVGTTLRSMSVLPSALRTSAGCPFGQYALTAGWIVPQPSPVAAEMAGRLNPASRCDRTISYRSPRGKRIGSALSELNRHAVHSTHPRRSNPNSRATGTGIIATVTPPRPIANAANSSPASILFANRAANPLFT